MKPTVKSKLKIPRLVKFECVKGTDAYALQQREWTDFTFKGIR